MSKCPEVPEILKHLLDLKRDNNAMRQLLYEIEHCDAYPTMPYGLRGRIRALLSGSDTNMASNA